MFEHHEDGGDAKAVGWISMSDMFMLCSIVMLGVAVSFALLLKKTDNRLASVQGDYANYKSVNTQTIEELTTKSEQLTKEAGGYKAQTINQEQQLGNLKTQLSETEKQRAALKARSDNLANELSAQTTKLGSVQGELDSLRNASSASIADLKSQVNTLTKDLTAQKAAVAALTERANSIAGKLAESEKEAANLKNSAAKLKTEGERLASELEKQTSKLTGDLAKVNSELAKAGGELARSRAELDKISGERDRLLADLAASKAANSALQKDDKDLKLKLIALEDDKKKAEARLKELGGTIAVLNGEIGELKPQMAKLQTELNGANLRVIDLEKLVFEKINRAKLVVTVTAEDVPKDFTLELFVTDPWGNECGPFAPGIFNEGDEIGVLQQSVDFRSGRAGSQKAVFYSMRPVYSGSESGGMYTVRAMIRHNSNDANVQLPHPVMVSCTVELPNIVGLDARKTAQLEINYPGYIKKTRRAGQLTASTQFKNMWPWEPVYHFERTVCDFRINGERITNFRTFEKIIADTPVQINGTGPIGRALEEQKIDSIRNRSSK
jgi:septal ring factor EnvC (AmiA/AmiB activator)